MPPSLLNPCRRSSVHVVADYRGMAVFARLLTVLVAFIALMVFPETTAFAHGDLEDGANLWMAWNVTPDIALSTLLVAGFYTVGVWRLRRRLDRWRRWRHVSFFAGLAVVFLALQSPVDPIAEHSFLVHQIQHLCLRMIGPMLIILSAPQGTLVVGTPDMIQRYIVNPAISNRFLRAFFSLLTHPVMATVIFIGALYFWQIPKIHNLALLNDYIHYLMHVSMLFAGLLFFWCVFDLRPAPMGTHYGTRLIMLWVAMLSNIAIGAYLTFKSIVLYPAYDDLGRLWETAMTDEQLGALIIWIPGGLLGLLSILIVLYKWRHQDTKDDSRRIAKLAQHGRGSNEPRMTDASLVAQTTPGNRAMALKFAAFIFCIFAAAIIIGVISQI